MNLRPTKRAQARFDYFSKCEDTKRLEPIPLDPSGHSASVCFFAHETYGKLLPCCEPELLSRALNGKEWHGLTVTNCAQDYIDRLFFSCDLVNYPEWVRKDILGRASQLAMQQIGFVPTFVRTGIDFTSPHPPLLPNPQQPA